MVLVWNLSFYLLISLLKGTNTFHFFGENFMSKEYIRNIFLYLLRKFTTMLNMYFAHSNGVFKLLTATMCPLHIYYNSKVNSRRY